MIPKGHKHNFNTLKQAFDNGDAALVECKRKDTGEAVFVICAMNREGGGVVTMIPVALMFNEDPYEMLVDPMTAADMDDKQAKEKMQ